MCAAELLRALELPADAVATSAEWGVAKPDHRFFARVIEMAPFRAEEILYVGDHRDHDILPARAAGLRAALIRRGPWGRGGTCGPKIRPSLTRRTGG